MKKLIKSILFLRKNDINPFFFILKNIIYFIRNKNILAHNKTTIKGLKNIDTSEGKLRIGLGYIGFLNKKTAHYYNF